MSALNICNNGDGYIATNNNECDEIVNTTMIIERTFVQDEKRFYEVPHVHVANKYYDGPKKIHPVKPVYF